MWIGRLAITSSLQASRRITNSSFNGWSFGQAWSKTGVVLALGMVCEDLMTWPQTEEDVKRWAGDANTFPVASQEVVYFGGALQRLRSLLSGMALVHGWLEDDIGTAPEDLCLCGAETENGEVWQRCMARTTGLNPLRTRTRTRRTRTRRTRRTTLTLL